MDSGMEWMLVRSLSLLAQLGDSSSLTVCCTGFIIKLHYLSNAISF